MFMCFQHLSSGAWVAQAASVPAFQRPNSPHWSGKGRSSRARWSQGVPLLAPTGRYFRAERTGPSLRRHQTPAKGRGSARWSHVTDCASAGGRTSDSRRRAVCCAGASVRRGTGGFNWLARGSLGRELSQMVAMVTRQGHPLRKRCSAGRQHKSGRLLDLGGWKARPRLCRVLRDWKNPKAPRCKPSA